MPLLMRYLKTPEGVQYLSSTSWFQQKLGDWVAGEPLTDFALSIETHASDYLKYLQGSREMRDFKYLSRLSVSNPNYLKSPLYITALIKLPWNIELVVNCDGRRSKRDLT
jgi:hypothetical protein